MTDLEPLRYPVGRFQRVTSPLDRATRAAHLDQLERLPATIRSLTQGRSDAALDTPYRPGGWTVRQVVHHVPDSHMNAYVRMKLAVTTDAPTITAYPEEKWAELADGKIAPIAMSVALLEALHQRWLMFLRGLNDADFAKVYVHPELGRVTVDEGLALYAWHSQHHSGHIRLGLATRG